MPAIFQTRDAEVSAGGAGPDEENPEEPGGERGHPKACEKGCRERFIGQFGAVDQRGFDQLCFFRVGRADAVGPDQFFCFIAITAHHGFGWLLYFTIRFRAKVALLNE